MSGRKRCAYCGEPCKGYGCRRHRDLSWLDPSRRSTAYALIRAQNHPQPVETDPVKRETR